MALDKDIIIGAASNYDWHDLEPWVTSIKQTDFEGLIVLAASNISKDTIDKLTDEGVTLSVYGSKQPDGSYTHKPGNAPHVERFFQIYNTLEKIGESRGVGYRQPYVVATDTRDVIFQKNPMEYLEDILRNNSEKIVVTSEGLTYENEPWGNQNLLDTFGPYFHEKLKGEEICNVGVIGGYFNEMQALMLNIFQMSVNRPIPICDQAVFNYLIRMEPWKTLVFEDILNEWCINLGTTMQAAKEGHGDIGNLMRTDPSYMVKYQKDYRMLQPTLFEDEVCDHARNRFTIVHQYDRIEEYNATVNERYRK